MLVLHYTQSTAEADGYVSGSCRENSDKVLFSLNVLSLGTCVIR